MRDISEIKKNLEDAEFALRHLEFAIRLDGYCNRNPRSDSFLHFLEELNIPHLCDLPQGLVNYDTPFSENEVIWHTEAAISVTLGVSAQILNKAYEQTGIKVIIPTNSTLEAVRLYINQIRNLFAHSTGAPIWDIIPKKRVAIELDINENNLQVDFAVLQGKEFEYSQIGGLRWWIDIAHFALDDIKSIIGEQKQPVQ